MQMVDSNEDVTLEIVMLDDDSSEGEEEQANSLFSNLSGILKTRKKQKKRDSKVTKVNKVMKSYLTPSALFNMPSSSRKSSSGLNSKNQL